MTLAKHNYHTAAPIPSHLVPADIIAALHDHNTCLSLQALTTGHTTLPDLDPEIRKDTFWYPPDVHPISAYSVTEIISYMPYFAWSKYNLTFPTYFQNTKHGLKTRADASGVILHAEFRVLRGDSVDGEVDGEGAGLGDVEFVLVEDVEVQCSWYMMPFVRGKMEAAHRDICRKVVEKVIMEKTQADIARMAASEKGKARVDTPTMSPTPVRIHTRDSFPRKRDSMASAGKRSSGSSTGTRSSGGKRDSNGKRDSGGKPPSPLTQTPETPQYPIPLKLDTSYKLEMAELEHTPVQPIPMKTVEKTVVAPQAEALPEKITYA
jgi:hypothetical protein